MKKKLLVVGIVLLLVIAVVGFFVSMLLKAPAKESVTGAVAGPETAGVEKTTADLSQIKEGMTEAEVLGVAGEPLEKQSVKTPRGNTIVYWYYEQGKDVYQVAFDSGVVSAVRVY